MIETTKLAILIQIAAHAMRRSPFFCATPNLVNAHVVLRGAFLPSGDGLGERYVIESFDLLGVGA